MTSTKLELTFIGFKYDDFIACMLIRGVNRKFDIWKSKCPMSNLEFGWTEAVGFVQIWTIACCILPFIKKAIVFDIS